MKRVAILLNMGGPRNLSEVDLFLKNMFADEFILNIKNAKFRRFIGFLIRKMRLKKSCENYKQIGSKSPMFDITSSLVKKLSNDDFIVDFAMNYVPPFVSDVLKKYQNFDEIVLFPLYPHHSCTTISSSLKNANDALCGLNFINKITEIPCFYNDEDYNEVLVEILKNKLKNLDPSEINLVFLAHSLPQKIVKNGDLYEIHINEHIEILTSLLKKNNIVFKNVILAYQSHLGPVKWLKPSVEDVLKSLGGENVFACPISFTIDNSETIFEIDILYAKMAKELGVRSFISLPCPNDSDEFVKFIDKKLRNAFCLK